MDETIFSAEDLEGMLKIYDAVEEGVKRYPVCQSSAFRGLIIARAAPYVEAVERAKAALETPEETGVTVKTADLKRLIGIHDDIFAAENAFQYDLDGYRLFRNQATNIHNARNNAMAVDAIRNALSSYSAQKGPSDVVSEKAISSKSRGRKTKSAPKQA